MSRKADPIDLTGLTEAQRAMIAQAGEARGRVLAALFQRVREENPQKIPRAIA